MTDLIAVAEWPKFDPSHKYAGFFQFMPKHGDFDYNIDGHILEMVLDHVQENVPLSVSLEFKYIPAVRKDSNYPHGQRGYIGWLYNPDRQNLPHNGVFFDTKEGDGITILTMLDYHWSERQRGNG